MHNCGNLLRFSLVFKLTAVAAQMSRPVFSLFASLIVGKLALTQIDPSNGEWREHFPDAANFTPFAGLIHERGSKLAAKASKATGSIGFIPLH
jgi:hypothetical protein